jgi:isoleucyl-tRNA synthetase
LKSPLSKFFPANPITLEKLTAQLYNPTFIHQWSGKWRAGNGLSIYRHLAKYFIKLAGIWDEMCQKFPGYCR